MRKFPLISCTLFGLALSFGVVACDSGDDGNGSGDGTETNNPTGDGDGDATTTTTGDGDGDPTGNGCYPAPEECTRLVECLGVIVPAAQADADAQLGENGSCWCGTEEEALACYDICKTQLDSAVAQNPTVGECHGRYCPLEELDPDQPYGPVVNGACPEGSVPQSLAGLDGTYCAPPCTGIADLCPGHSQSNGDGTCLNNGNCALLCYVEPYNQLGTQCQCGATCQPLGQSDGNGNPLGICTFE